MFVDKSFLLNIFFDYNLYIYWFKKNYVIYIFIYIIFYSSIFNENIV